MSEKEKKQFEKVKNKLKSSGGGTGNKKKPFNFYWIYAVILIAIVSVNLFSISGGVKEISFTEFKEYANEGDVDKVVEVNGQFIEIYIKTEAIEKSSHKENLKKMTPQRMGKGPQYKCILPGGTGSTFSEQIQELSESQGFNYVSEPRDNWVQEILSWLIPMALILVLWLFIMRRMAGGSGGGPGGQIFNIGKSKAQVYEKGKTTNVTFSDVAGLEGPKEEIKEIVDFLKAPKRYTDLGAKIPKGALLVGPPGTGKTLLAKAVAGEAKVPFFSLSGSDFVEMFVGVGASRVRDLFRQAKEKAPAIIFIDEIDAIGRARGRNPNMGSNDERENTLNQLLTEMDGFGTNSGVIILAATNRGDILDRALLRAGRFDRQIMVDMPDVVERKEIFLVHLKPLKLDKSIDIDLLSKQTPGFSGADIANLCNEAALIAARKKKLKVEMQDFLDAVDRIIGGLEKKHKLISAEEKKVIAYHEAGHATVSWLLEHASPLVKVTIVPRGRSLGAAWYLPEERQITTTEQLFDEMCAAMGGRAAEKVIFKKISTGALSDLEKVNKQARAMVTIYGLNDRLGNVSYYDSQEAEYSFNKPYSEETAKLIDEEISKLVESAYVKAIELLENHQKELNELANVLLEKEVIFKEDLEKIFGKRPWGIPEENELKEVVGKVEGEGESEEKKNDASANASTEKPKKEGASEEKKTAE